MADVVDVLRERCASLPARLPYAQLDAPHYPLLIDPHWRAFYEARGWSVDEWLR